MATPPPHLEGGSAWAAMWTANTAMICRPARPSSFPRALLLSEKLVSGPNGGLGATAPLNAEEASEPDLADVSEIRAHARVAVPLSLKSVKTDSAPISLKSPIGLRG